ncbi:DUF3800 domain-containing protein [Jiella avicenniae]|uniref:DUF3800 domain-containing protein n=1 Tax=Jiella avicenniae TaxID=2907202 RepID=A0A9X1T627_9HYPH|nr:DUF3800 domain-containing protein [Jiella avicenniae]MCE7029847.1 DUF3800 domain-containing protein [Jiella avicenniae]
MYLLYLDYSGSSGNASDKHVILAGFAVFERQPHWLSLKLDDLAKEMWPENPQGLEFRGADMFSGKRHWRGVEKARRLDAYRRALAILGTSRLVHVFGVAVHKASVSPDDPMERAFEAVANRFDRFLGRLHKQNNTQRGLIVLDKSSYETSLQGLATNFRSVGHRWGQLFNLTDVPLFVDSRATRLIQYADLVAYALRRYYENGQSAYLDTISGRFDAQGGVVHGLAHMVSPEYPCNCQACRQRVRT